VTICHFDTNHSLYLLSNKVMHRPRRHRRSWPVLK